MIAQGPGKSPDWIEFGLRDALFRDGRRIAAELCNDRTLFPDSEMPLAFDTCDHHRSRNVETRPGKQEDGSASTREAKLGCVFTQTVTDDQGRPMRDPGSTSYVGTYQGCREIGVMLHQETRRRALDRPKQVI